MAHLKYPNSFRLPISLGAIDNTSLRWVFVKGYCWKGLKVSGRWDPAVLSLACELEPACIPCAPPAPLATPMRDWCSNRSLLFEDSRVGVSRLVGSLWEMLGILFWRYSPTEWMVWKQMWTKMISYKYFCLMNISQFLPSAPFKMSQTLKNSIVELLTSRRLLNSKTIAEVEYFFLDIISKLLTLSAWNEDAFSSYQKIEVLRLLIAF